MQVDHLTIFSANHTGCLSRGPNISFPILLPPLSLLPPAAKHHIPSEHPTAGGPAPSYASLSWATRSADSSSKKVVECPPKVESVKPCASQPGFDPRFQPIFRLGCWLWQGLGSGSGLGTSAGSGAWAWDWAWVPALLDVGLLLAWAPAWDGAWARLLLVVGLLVAWAGAWDGLGHVCFRWLGCYLLGLGLGIGIGLRCWCWLGVGLGLAWHWR